MACKRLLHPITPCTYKRSENTKGQENTWPASHWPQHLFQAKPNITKTGHFPIVGCVQRSATKARLAQERASFWVARMESNALEAQGEQKRSSDLMPLCLLPPLRSRKRD